MKELNNPHQKESSWIEEFKDKFNWTDIFGKDSKAEQEVINFISALLLKENQEHYEKGKRDFTQEVQEAIKDTQNIQDLTARLFMIITHSLSNQKDQ